MENNTEEMKRIKYLTKIRKFDEALSKIDFLIKSNPNDVKLLTYKAMVYGRMGKGKEGMEIILDSIPMLKTDEERIFAYEIAASIEENYGEFEDAIIYRERVLELTGNKLYQKSVAALARLYYKNNEKGKAIKLLDKYKNVNTLMLNISRAYIHYYEGEYDKALESLNLPTTMNALKDSRSVLDKQYIEALIHEKHNNYDKALELYNQICKTGNDTMSIYWDARYQSAKIYYSQGKEDRVVQICEEIINVCKKYRDYTGACDLLATIYINRNEIDKAKEVYNKSIMPEYKNIGLARMSILNKDYDNAFHYLSTTKDLEYEKAFIRDYYYAVIMYRYGNYKQFKHFYNSCMRTKNDDTVEYAHNLNEMLVSLKFKTERECDYTISYNIMQMLNYDPTHAITHMKETTDVEDVEALYNMLPEHLENPMVDGAYDKYIVDLKKIGYSNTSRHVLVTCLADTKNIIDIKKASEYIPGEDFKVAPVQKKRLSALDKFNKKYGL